MSTASNTVRNQQGICPVCKRHYCAERVPTNGHIFPELCRDSGSVVDECSECNNWLGSVADVALNAMAGKYRFAYQDLNAKQLETFFKHHVKIKGMNGKPIRVVSCKIVSQRIKLEIAYIKEPPKPVYINSTTYKFTWDIESYHAKQIVGALLHSAVLWSSYHFDGSVLYSDGLDLLRKPLNDACHHKQKRKKAIDAFSGYHDLTRILIQLPSNKNEIYILRNEEYKPMSYVLFVPYYQRHGSMVLLPGLGSSALSQYQCFLNGVGSKKYYLESTHTTSDDLVQMGRKAASKWYENRLNEIYVKNALVTDFEFGSADKTIQLNNLETEKTMPMDFMVRPIRANRDEFPGNW